MFAPLAVEFKKLNRSLVLLLAIAAPTLIALFNFFMQLRAKGPPEWPMITQGSAAIWAFFMLPMSVTALAALAAQMEHGPKSWDHLFALPVARWRLLMAKIIAVVVVVAAMSLGVFCLAWLAAMAAGWIKPEVAATGTFPALDFARTLGLMLAASMLLVAVQLWTSLRYRSFVPGLVLGIGGTFFAVVATSAKEGVFLPWQIPVNMLATDPVRVQTALAVGAVGGLIGFVVLIVHLSRRDVL